MYIKSTDSTNTLLRQMIAGGNPPEYIRTDYQTAGRGQTGNGWESQKGKNLLCSILLPPKENLFELNIAASVAVHRLIKKELPDAKCQSLTVKWPNDIYYGDKKLAGILIENAIIGSKTKYSIAGIGLNVNQTEFVSDAPNPVSMKQITGQDYNLDYLMRNLYEEVQKALQEDVWTYYKAHLYRREGFWPFVEREVNTAPTMNADPMEQGQFWACIEDVMTDGEIVLRDKQGLRRTYHFKQVRYVV